MGASLAPRLVVFDIGRVLVRICDDWKQACSLAGIEFSPARVDEAQMLRLRDAVLRHEVGQTSWEQFVGKAAGPMGLSPQQVCAMSSAFLRQTYPGAVELVDELNAAGIETACLSNTNEHHWAIFSQPDHPAYFPLDRLTHRFASHLVGARKPQDAIYEKVEQATGRRGDSIIFFDDVLENVQGGLRRGWLAHRVDPSSEDPIRDVRRILASHHILQGIR